MPQFYADPKNIINNRFLLEGKEARQLSLVLRKRPGEEIRIFDGNGNTYLGRISELTDQTVKGSIVKKIETAPPSIHIRIFQGMPKGKKLETLIEFANELGISEIVPVITTRTISRPSPEAFEKHIERLKTISINSAKRSGCTKYVQVGRLVDFSEALAMIKKTDVSVIPWEQEKVTSLAETLALLNKPEHINVLIGPEGGLTTGEIELAKRHGAVPVSLGPNILRTETAALVATAGIWFRWPV